MNAQGKPSMHSENLNSFKAVFERHFDEVYGYIAYRVAPDSEEARDLTQEVFLAAFKAWGTYRGDASPLTWLRSIARRKIADHFNARAQQNSATGAASLTNVTNGCTDLDERAAILSRAMRQLPLDRVQLLEEKYLEGRSVREIANQRGISERAVESALSRARGMLREQFLRFQAIEEASNERQ
jgi:RNA polymerase sigma-70 factor (ECF subfamily)